MGSFRRIVSRDRFQMSALQEMILPPSLVDLLDKPYQDDEDPVDDDLQEHANDYYEQLVEYLEDDDDAF